MNIKKTDPPRAFNVGSGGQTTIMDCAHIELGHDEQVTFHTESGGEYDVVRKSWGFYATPSLNQRLPSFGFRTALVRNAQGNTFIMLVEKEHEALFTEYLLAESQEVIEWLGE